MTSLAEKLTSLGIPSEVLTKVEAAKGAGCMVELLTLGEQNFIYRSLNRLEWKNIQRRLLAKARDQEGNIDTSKILENKEESEEEVVTTALIWPSLGRDQLLSLPSGWISTLADRITELSGFSAKVETPVKL